MAEAETPQKRTCGICPRELSPSNKNPFCNSHTPEEKLEYTDRAKAGVKSSRNLRDFIGEFHKSGTVKDMFAEAAKRKTDKKDKISRVELEQYHEALCLMYIASRTFHLSMPGILKLGSTSKTGRLIRDILVYLMSVELKMGLEEICTFLGYKHPPTVTAAIKRMKDLLLDDEKMIMAVDIVLRQYKMQIAEYQD